MINQLIASPLNSKGRLFDEIEESYTTRTPYESIFDSFESNNIVVKLFFSMFLRRSPPSRAQRIQSHTYTTARRRRLDRTFRILNT